MEGHEGATSPTLILKNKSYDARSQVTIPQSVLFTDLSFIISWCSCTCILSVHSLFLIIYYCFNFILVCR